jgi:large subunit ribosomal protein L30
MIALIRIAGQLHIDWSVDDTLTRLRLGKKFTCVVVDERAETLGMIKKVKDFIAFGKIDEKTLTELIKARGKVIGDTKAKIKDPEKIAKEIMAGKKFEELGVKPFFGLHPARGGIDSKHHYPKGVRGNHGENINKLIMKML